MICCLLVSMFGSTLYECYPLLN